MWKLEVFINDFIWAFIDKVDPTLSMNTFTLDQQRKNRKTVYTLNEIQPTGPARRLATQQVGYD